MPFNGGPIRLVTAVLHLAALRLAAGAAISAACPLT